MAEGNKAMSFVGLHVHHGQRPCDVSPSKIYIYICSIPYNVLDANCNGQTRALIWFESNLESHPPSISSSVPSLEKNAEPSSNAQRLASFFEALGGVLANHARALWQPITLMYVGIGTYQEDFEKIINSGMYISSIECSINIPNLVYPSSSVHKIDSKLLANASKGFIIDTAAWLGLSESQYSGDQIMFSDELWYKGRCGTRTPWYKLRELIYSIIGVPSSAGRGSKLIRNGSSCQHTVFSRLQVGFTGAKKLVLGAAQRGIRLARPKRTIKQSDRGTGAGGDGVGWVETAVSRRDFREKGNEKKLSLPVEEKGKEGRMVKRKRERRGETEPGTTDSTF